MSGPGATGGKRSRQRHAARVAIAATVVVMAAYLIAVTALNLLVAHRLIAQADGRLAQRLTQVSAHTAVPPQPKGDSDHDIDDAPRFVWVVSEAGIPVPLTSGSPTLPHRVWRAGSETVEVDGTPFRFQVKMSGGGWLVAGESLAQLTRVQSALLAPELVFGLVLTVITFVGALIIGLRASAPLEIVHRRQVEFTADASHELRTPLSVIEAEVDLALSRPRPAGQYEEVLQRIAGEGRRLRSIVEDLLWLARIDDEQSTTEPTGEVDVGQMAVTLVERFQPIASAGDVTLCVERESSEPAAIRADRRWVDRMMGVLIDNACKFAGVGGRVEVGVRLSGNRVVLTVDDSGPGIPVDQRSLVLDRFHRGTDQPGGTGLGLAIADSVVRATDGTWLIGDAPLGGARLAVSWKRAAPGRTRSVPPPDGGRQDRDAPTPGHPAPHEVTPR